MFIGYYAGYGYRRYRNSDNEDCEVGISAETGEEVEVCQSSGGENDGVILGVIIAVVVCICCLICVFIFLMFRRAKKEVDREMKEKEENERKEQENRAGDK